MPALLLLTAVSLSACGASLNSGGLSSDGGPPQLGAGDATQTGTVSSEPRKTAVVQNATPEARKLAAQSASPFIAASAPGNTAYKIGPQDVLEVSVFQVQELSRAVQVTDSGVVGLPLIGEVPAAGRTAQEIERDVASKLKVKYLQNPQVSVFVKEFNSQRVTIEGSVKKTGVYPLRGKTSLLQALSMAEGLDAAADTAVVVFRQGEKGRMAARFDVAEIRSGSTEDPLIQAGDVIVVGSSFWKEQYGNFVKLLPLIGLFALL